MSENGETASLSAIFRSLSALLLEQVSGGAAIRGRRIRRPLKGLRAEKLKGYKFKILLRKNFPFPLFPFLSSLSLFAS